MGKIVIVTLNPAIDRVVEASDPCSPQPSPETEGLLFPAGKGANVAKTVEALGGEAVILGLIGQNAHTLFKTLQSPFIRVQLTEVESTTRTNLTVYDPVAKRTVHTRTAGFKITTGDVERLYLVVHETVSQDDVVVLTGSLPAGAEVSLYREIIVRLNAQRVRTILDSSGAEFVLGLEGQPFAVKPNLEELEFVAGRPLSAEAHIVKAAREICDRGIHLVVVSRGSEGVLAVSRDGSALKANVAVDEDHALTGAVGSGDALVAGIAAGLLELQPISELVQLGVACGAANLLSLGPGVCQPEDIARILPRVQVSEIPS